MKLTEDNLLEANDDEAFLMEVGDQLLDEDDLPRVLMEVKDRASGSKTKRSFTFAKPQDEILPAFKKSTGDPQEDLTPA